MHTLVGLHYSPWTEKARWALEHHAVPHRYEEYVPMIGEPLLRIRTRRPFGRVTVPVLLPADGADAVFDSFAIAELAERTGSGARLFPEDRAPQVRAWNERSEAAMRGARAVTVYRMQRDARAQAEALPAFVPAPLRPHLTAVARLGTAFVARKYGAGSGTFEAEGVLRDGLDALRTGLDGGRKSYLLGELTFADVAMAQLLQGVVPVRHPAFVIGDAMRAVWTHAELARQYADLVEWRDALYAKHRAPARRPAHAA